MRFKPGDIVRHKISKKKYVVRKYYIFTNKFIHIPRLEISAGVDDEDNFWVYESELEAIK